MLFCVLPKSSQPIGWLRHLDSYHALLPILALHLTRAKYTHFMRQCNTKIHTFAKYKKPRYHYE